LRIVGELVDPLRAEPVEDQAPDLLVVRGTAALSAAQPALLGANWGAIVRRRRATQSLLKRSILGQLPGI
jgi:hypothetical protein